jgi:hypothetical protein
MIESSAIIDSEALKVYSDSLFRSVGFASQVVQLLISLSTGVLAFTITFSKEIAPSSPRSVRGFLATAWLFYFISIPFGVVTMMAFTGLLTQIDIINFENINSEIIRLEDLKYLSIDSPYITIPAILQFVSFFLGMFVSFTYGF